MSVERIDVPQANKLETVRLLVQAVANGFVTLESLEEPTRLTARHVRYYAHAARVLGFVEDKNVALAITREGSLLLSTAPHSEEENALLTKAVVRSPVVVKLAGDLFGGIDKETLARRIQTVTGLATATSERRADTLLSWRAQLASRSEELRPFVIESGSRPGNTPPHSLEVNSPSPDAAGPSHETQQPSEAAVHDSSPQPSPDGENARIVELPRNIRENLATQIAKGRVCLFTGAGFSMAAKDRSGQMLPSGIDLAKEIWNLLYTEEIYDNSTLPDLFAAAMSSSKRELERLLRRRFEVADSSLPEEYNTWFQIPWRRVYTLNVDDIELAAGRRFHLSRKPRSVSALPGTAVDLLGSLRDLTVVHLNGIASDGATGVTFEPRQYGQRASEQDPAYTSLVGELLAFPFVFVGTQLDEPLLWQHIELRRKKDAGTHELRPRSFLVTPTLSRARRALLAEYNVYWVQATAEQFAKQVLSELMEESTEGHRAIAAAATANSDSSENIMDVGELLAVAGKSKTEFLRGAEPDWSDITSGRAIVRESDNAIYRHSEQSITRIREDAPFVLLTGTAGSGKSTSLMRLAATLSASGLKVGWIGSTAEVSPRTVRGVDRSSAGWQVVAIDDIDRYGIEAGAIVKELRTIDRVVLVIASSRSTKADRVLTALDRVDGVAEMSIPHLEDTDIAKLLDVLGREKRLGKLTGLSYKEQVLAFEKSAQRQLLVAMIEATLGVKFEERVMSEWDDLKPDPKFAYMMLAIATSLRYQPRKGELLLALSGATQGNDLAVLRDLETRHLVVVRKDRYSVRHRVIADKVLDGVIERGISLRSALANLALGISVDVTVDTNKKSWRVRFLKALLNNEYLFRMTDLDGARSVYDATEDNLSWDHHFWLQRGSLEVKYGDIRRAESWLKTAYAINDSDPLVITEYAYMLFRKAVHSPTAVDAAQWAEEATDLLKSQIAERGDRSAHPYHILGSQGLAWSRKVTMTTDERKDYLVNLLTFVRNGATKHPRAPELQGLRDDMQREVLALKINPPRN